MKTLDPDDRKSILDFSCTNEGDIIELKMDGRSVLCTAVECMKLRNCRECLLILGRDGRSHVTPSLCYYLASIIREAVESGEIAQCSKSYHLMLVPLEDLVE